MMIKKSIVVLILFLLICIHVTKVTGDVQEDKIIYDRSNHFFAKTNQILNRNLNHENWIEQDKFLSPSGVSNNFGKSVSIFGKYAIVGVYRENNNTGSAYVYKRNGTNWIKQQQLTASDGKIGDCFGYSVSIDGNLAIVGAYGDENGTGSVYVFNNSGTTWVEEEKLMAPDGSVNDWFGYSVSIDGNYVIVGAYGDDDFTGSAYLFENCCAWKIREKMNTSNGLPYFGWSVSVSGDYAIIGAPGAPASNSTGSTYIFQRGDGIRWYEKANWSGENSGQYLGISVSIDGNYAIAGAYGDNEGTGIVYTFQRTGEDWLKGEKLTASDGNKQDYFGVSVTIDGNYTIIGAFDDENSMGSAYVFKCNDTIWTEEQKLIASDGESNDYFGYSLSINGGYIIIGAYGDDNFKGSAYIFMKKGVPNLSFEITGGIGVSAKVTNYGDNDTTNTSVKIHVWGGIFGLVNKSVSEMIDISAGETKSVSTGVFLGLDIINVWVKVNEKHKTTEGLQIFIFTFV